MFHYNAYSILIATYINKRNILISKNEIKISLLYFNDFKIKITQIMRTREPFTRVTKKRSGLSAKRIVRDVQLRNERGKGEGTSAPRWYTWCNWCTSPHASLHSYETLLSARYNGCHALWSVDTLCSIVRAMICDTDSFRLSHNELSRRHDAYACATPPCFLKTRSSRERNASYFDLANSY